MTNSGDKPVFRKKDEQSADVLKRASADLLQKLPPQNIEAEQAVLGGVFLRNETLHTLIDMLGVDDFYSPAHRLIFEAFSELYRVNRPVDLLTVTDWLQKQGQLEAVGGSLYLASLSSAVVSAANSSYHAEIVREKSIRRRLISTSSEILSRCFDAGESVDALLDRSEQEVFSIAESKNQAAFVSSKELVSRVFKQLEERVQRQELVTGVPTSYDKFDELTSGLQPTDLIIVAGRPGMGKTAFALNVALRAAVFHEVPTAIFTLEMSMEQLIMRMLCSWGKVDLSKLRNGFLNDEDWSRLYSAADALGSAPIYIDDTPALGTLEMRSKCRRLKKEKNIGLVIVDYLQLMRASRKIDSREQEISEISRTLKALAKEMDLPVVALSQLNRKVDERSDKHPVLSDLRESGAIEQDADLIVFLYRDEEYNKSEDNPRKGIAEVIIAKHRNGPQGKIELAYLSRFTAFENLSGMPTPSEAGGM